MWMTIKGYAAFSKSLCVLYMHVWYTEFCGNCPLEWDFFFSCMIVHLCILSLTELRFLAECACIFVFAFPETDLHILSVFQAS